MDDAGIPRERVDGAGENAAPRPVDPLTDLPTRAAFVQDLLDAARIGHAPPTVLQVGIDRFRDVNSRLGPDAADAVLVEVARRLRATAAPDVLVARLGGDEFGLLVRGPVDAAGAESLAERILAATAAPCAVPDPDGAVTDVVVGVSVGLAARGAEHARDRREVQLLTAADAAMRRAKDRGRGRYAWWSAPARSGADDHAFLDLEPRLRAALAASAITLHYQPVVELPSGRVTGVEALARWDDPELGPVPPDRFVAVAERSGLIFDLGTQVLRRACRDAATLRSAPDDVPLSVAVNVSALQLADPGFVRDVADALAESGMPPARLCLEITETAAIGDVEVAAHRLRELRALGVTLALDDFGTGYSSLTMLRHLPVDLVKMDRSFVAHLTSDAQDAVLARLIVDAAHGMGMQVCAEGVETVQQARQLVALGCDRAQGWYWSAAHPPGDRLREALALDRPVHDTAWDPRALDLPMTGTDELVLVTDPRGLVQFASGSTVRLLGSPAARLVGSHVLDHLRPAGCAGSDDGASDDGASDDGTSAGGPLDGGLPDGTRRMRADHAGDGSARWLEVRTSTVHRHDGRPPQSLSVARDVTAVVRAEEEMAASERLFRHAFDDAPIGMAMTALDGRFLRVNRAFAQMLGRSPEEVLRTTVDALTVADDRAADAANLDELRRGTHVVHDVVKRYLHRDGHPVPARVRAAVVEAQDDTASYVLAHVLGYQDDAGPDERRR